MRRRASLKILAAGGIVSAIGGGYHWISKERDHADLALELLMERLDALALDSIETTGTWEVARTFNHLAQSVEFSMTGYPVMKSKFFRNSVGRLAFSVFQANGRMTHGLDEEIPGEIVNPDNTSPAQARIRLIKSLEKFSAYEETLRPHFAYGGLNKDQYALAHAMHVNNHLEEFRNA